MGGFVLAWLFGEGLIAWRSVSQQKMPPSPRQLLLASGLFAGLAVLAEYQPARFTATAFAWAVYVAVLMKVLPGSGDPAAIKAGTASGWAGIGTAGNTVIIPDWGTDSAVIASEAPTATSSGSGGSGGSGTSTGGAAGGGSASANQAVAKQVIGANSAFSGWDSGGQWQCLVNLWNQESGWSASARNPSSGALGIAQALGHGTGSGGEYGGYGLTAAQDSGANSGNAADQILWGLNYIAKTYGSPCAAWSHEQSNNWY
jgi:hypothetical protein